MDLEKIPNRRQRLALTRLTIELLQLWHDGFRRGGGTPYRESLSVVAPIYAESFVGRGITISKISLVSGLPRSTVQRRAEILIRAGFVRRERNRFWIVEEKLLYPPADLKRAMSIVRRTASEIEEINRG